MITREAELVEAQEWELQTGITPLLQPPTAAGAVAMGPLWVSRTGLFYFFFFGKLLWPPSCPPAYRATSGKHLVHFASALCVQVCVLRQS